MSDQKYNYRIQRRRTLNSVVISPIKEFLSDSKSVGILLLASTVVSLLLANLPATSEGYIGFWHKETTAIVEGLHLPHSILHWINDFFMAFYFFLVSMEIKREITIGELSSFKKVSLPLFGAIGGMLMPALIYVMANYNSPYVHGWGIPMATDIAFSLGLLSLLGKRAPLSLKVLLMALAIIDDLGGIIAIAIFYTDHIDLQYLMMAVGVTALMILLIRLRIARTFILLILAFILWYFLFNSGIHATIAGVIVGLLVPLDRIAELEHTLHDPVNFVIMPIFALANTAFLIPADVGLALTHSASMGIILGLMIGKPLGITLFSYLGVKSGVSELPESLNWTQILGMGMSGGIGFTISIFISGLAYRNHDIQSGAVLAIIIASLLSGLFAYITIYRASSGAVYDDEEEDSEDYEDIDS